MSQTYKKAGVDIFEAAKVKKEIKRIVEVTYNENVLAGVGPFGSLYNLKEVLMAYQEPVLVQSVDGVGTKIEIARAMNSLRTIGEDLVNHSINDILCQGAKPLIFLDYIAQDKLRPEEIKEIILGMAMACKAAGISLVGGETAQLLGIYQKGCSDVVGFITGIVEKSKIIDGHLIKPGDRILGLPSSGLHTNGYSLVRKIFFRDKKWSPYFYFQEIDGQLGRVLLAPHKSYLEPISFLEEYRNALGLYFVFHGLAHITGGGFKKNIERILPENCQAQIRIGSWPVLPIFQFIQKTGLLSTKEMYQVFNMGIGMVLIVSPLEVEEIHNLLWQKNQPIFLIGEIKEGKKGVIFWRQND